MVWFLSWTQALAGTPRPPTHTPVPMLSAGWLRSWPQCLAVGDIRTILITLIANSPWVHTQGKPRNPPSELFHQVTLSSCVPRKWSFPFLRVQNKELEDNIT
jgi:hypothetical protein